MLIKTYTYDEIRRVLKVRSGNNWPINYYIKKKSVDTVRYLKELSKMMNQESVDKLFNLIDLCLLRHMHKLEICPPRTIPKREGT